MNQAVFFLTFLFSFTSLFSQPYYFRHYQVENGLSNNTVFCSLQDEKGFLWVGTKDGLCRFDGYAFKLFRNDPEAPGSIGNNNIRCLYADRQGGLWIGTDRGLFAYEQQTERFALLPQTGGKNIRDIKADLLGTMWFIADGKVMRYDPVEKKTEQNQDLKNMFATSIAVAKDQTVWVSTDMGHLMQYNFGRHAVADFDVFKNSTSAKSRWIEKICLTEKNAILVGTSNQGVKLFDIAATSYQDILFYNEDKTDIFARDFLHVSGDTYWIATESGIFVYRLDTKSFTHLRKKYNDPYSLSDNAVYTLTKDKEGGIWAGTYFRGLDTTPTSNSFSGNLFRRKERTPSAAKPCARYAATSKAMYGSGLKMQA